MANGFKCPNRIFIKLFILFVKISNTFMFNMISCLSCRSERIKEREKEKTNRVQYLKLIIIFFFDCLIIELVVLLSFK
jgi:hypothetical protein